MKCTTTSSSRKTALSQTLSRALQQTVSDAINNKTALHCSDNKHQTCATPLWSHQLFMVMACQEQVRYTLTLFWCWLNSSCWLGAASAFPPDHGQEEHEQSSSRDPSNTSERAQLTSGVDDEEGSGHKQTQPCAEG